MRHRRLALALTVAVFVLAAGQRARGQNRQIWSGVYASEQAEQGKRLFESNCATCHRSDLSGDRGPALTGDRFFTSWQSGSVNRLYSKIKETMPPNRGSVGLTEDNFLSIVAYILESNAFPASKDDTLLTPDVLDDVVIARRDGGGSSGPANFALVEVVGCLTQGADNQWTLTHASQPVITRDQPATAEELQASLAKPPGADTFVLLSVARFKPASLQGQRLAARGLVYKSPTDALISLTSLQVVGSTCS
jgi:mono/diheme cytochrome c family protein